MGTQVQRSIRLSPFNATSLDRTSGESGGIIYDQTNQTLRINNGRTNGGSILATRSWVTANTFSGSYNDLTDLPEGGGNSGSGASVTVGTTAPTDPTSGNLWLDSSDGSLYVYLTSQWIQPSVPPASLIGYATQSYVTSTIDSNLTSYATKNYVDVAVSQIAAPDLTGYATENYVTTAIGNIPPTDLTGYATETYVDTTISTAIGSISFSNISGIGLSRGVVVAEFSTDDSMTDNANDTVPVESAVRGYIDRRLGFDHDGVAIPTLNLIGSGVAALSGASFSGNLVANNNVSEGLNVVGGITLGLSQERYLTIGISSTTPTHTLGPGYFGWTSIFNCSGQTANFTPNIEGVPTTGNSVSGVDTVITFTYIMNQGASNPGLPTALKINNVAQTIKWQGGSAPIGTANKVDVVTFNCFINSNTEFDGLYTVLGSMTSFG